MRLLVIAVGFWIGLLGTLAIAGWLVRRWRRRPNLDDGPVSRRWLDNHVRSGEDR